MKENAFFKRCQINSIPFIKGMIIFHPWSTKICSSSRILFQEEYYTQICSTFLNSFRILSYCRFIYLTSIGWWFLQAFNDTHNKNNSYLNSNRIFLVSLSIELYRSLCDAIGPIYEDIIKVFFVIALDASYMHSILQSLQYMEFLYGIFKEVALYGEYFMEEEGCARIFIF